jgi:PEP-CTERM motif
MVLRAHFLLFGFLFHLIAALTASADPIRTTVTVGAATSSNLYPFGSGPGQFEYRGVYQQIYAAESFGRSLRIDEIAFQTVNLSGEPQSVASSFSLRLGTTASSPLTPAPTYAGNRGQDLSQLFQGTVTLASTNNGTFDFVIPLSRPFLYDNARGNLLLEVFIVENMTSHLFAAGGSDVTGRVFNFGGTGASVAEGGFGLRTQFSGTAEDTAPVPEPSTMLLLATGTALVIRGARRRRRNEIN